MIRLLKRLFLDNWRKIDQEGWEEEKRDKYDFRPLLVLVTVCVALTLQEYVGQGNTFTKWFPDQIQGEYGSLKRYAWWSGWRFIGYVLIPCMVIFSMPGEKISSYYISLKDFFKHLPIYLGLYLLILPAVIIASKTDSFNLTYPFYKLANRSSLDLWVWEGLYSLQFLSLEFFFRGFMLKALRPRFGSGAIFVMLVPYCMIHYGKPMAETYGAIIAGLVLGTLAMRTKSIWGGVLIHLGVALTMDFMSLSQCPDYGETSQPCPSHPWR